jgi:hypothetical protein
MTIAPILNPYRALEWFLIGGLCFCAVASFVYMVRNNHPLSTILWLINPLNWVLPGWGSDEMARYNPTWLRVLTFIIGLSLVSLLIYEMLHI